MDMKFEDQVRERAYHIWMSAGMEDGMAHEHWMRAEQAVVAETATPVKSVAKKAAAKKVVAPKVAEKAPAKKAAAKPAAKASKVKH